MKIKPSYQKAIFAFSCLLCWQFSLVLAQTSHGIGTINPNPKAIFDVYSTTQGVLLPRMSTLQRTSMALTSNDAGMIVFDNLLGAYFVWNGVLWQQFLIGTTANAILQNGNTFATGIKIGTIDNQKVSFITNNTEKVSINQNGKVGIGVSTAATFLDVKGDFSLRETVSNSTDNNIMELDIGNSSFVNFNAQNSDFKIFSIANPQDGKIVVLYNSTIHNMTIKKDNGNSGNQNMRIRTHGGDFVTDQEGTATLIYSAQEQRWILISAIP